MRISDPKFENTLRAQFFPEIVVCNVVYEFYVNVQGENASVGYMNALSVLFEVEGYEDPTELLSKLNNRLNDFDYQVFIPAKPFELILAAPPIRIEHTVRQNQDLYEKYGVVGHTHIPETEMLCEVIRKLETNKT